MLNQEFTLVNLPGEVWKSVAGYEGLYSVSNYGRIKSLEKTVQGTDGKIRVLKPRIKKYAISNGYPVVSLCKDSITRVKFVHRIIALAFLPNPEHKPNVDHINRNTLDFRLENLRWTTQKENMNNPNSVEYCRQHVNKKETALLANETKRQKGTKTAPRMVFQYGLDGTFIAEYDSMNDAERKTGLCHSGIGQVLDKPAYTFGGCLWASRRCSNYTHTPNTFPFYKPIVKFGSNGEVVAKWASMTKAAKDLGVSRKYLERRIRMGEFAFASIDATSQE